MELIYKPDKVIEMWQERMKEIAVGFAWIQTTKVMHDRAAVVADNERNITVEFPVHKSVGSKSSWSIRQEVIPKSEIVAGWWYED